MSVESGGGSAVDDRMPEALRGAGYNVFGYIYERFAVRLFDYCLGVLADEVAAVIAVQETLATADAQIGQLPDPDRLRILLYSVAHRQCLGRLPRRRGRPSRGSQTITFDKVVAEQGGPASAGWATGRDTLPVLAGLADRDREVLNLVFRHGFDDADLAVVLGVSPRRARAMLSDAGTRFRESAAVVAVIRGDLAGCEALEAITGKLHPAAPPLTPERREQLSRHLKSCRTCSEQHGEQVLAPEMLSAVPLATPPLTLRLRITGPAPAPGPHRQGDGSRTSPPGGDGSRHWAGRGVPHARPIFSVVLVVLAVLGVVVYKLVLATSSARPAAAPMAAAPKSPTSTRSPPMSPALDPQGSEHQRKPAPLPPLLGPVPLGVLPLPTQPGTGTPTSPASAHTKPPTTVPSTSPPTTSAPTTPAPTTPAGTPTPTPTLTATPTPTLTAAPTPTLTAAPAV